MGSTWRLITETGHAKLKIQSIFSSRRSSGSIMSCLMNLKFGWSRNASILRVSRVFIKLSTQITRCPSSRYRFVRTEPSAPAPPVMRTTFLFDIREHYTVGYVSSIIPHSLFLRRFPAMAQKPAMTASPSAASHQREDPNDRDPTAAVWASATGVTTGSSASVFGSSLICFLATCFGADFAGALTIGACVAAWTAAGVVLSPDF